MSTVNVDLPDAIGTISITATQNLPLNDFIAMLQAKTKTIFVGYKIERNIVIDKVTESTIINQILKNNLEKYNIGWKYCKWYRLDTGLKKNYQEIAIILYDIKDPLIAVEIENIGICLLTTLNTDRVNFKNTIQTVLSPSGQITMIDFRSESYYAIIDKAKIIDSGKYIKIWLDHEAD